MVCEMRLIDADKLTKDLIYKSFYPVIVKRAIEEAPTEDVVPRAEVEELNWQLEREREYIEFLKTNLLKAKQEVAREIFYLIDNYINIVETTVGFDLDFLIKSITELKKKYTGE